MKTQGHPDDKVAQSHGYKNFAHLEKERSKPNYSPGPGSPKVVNGRIVKP